MSLAVSVLPVGVAAQEAELSVMMRDGNPHDRIFIRNTGSCSLVSGVLGLDFRPSEGGVLIDTEYGGAGTQDPMPVEVEHGPLRVRPVIDGDRRIVIEVDGLAPGGSGTVTLDVDNEASGWRAARVSIIGDHVAGATARFVADGHDGSGVFDTSGGVVIPLPQEACDTATPPDVADMAAPIS